MIRRLQLFLQYITSPIPHRTMWEWFWWIVAIAGVLAVVVAASLRLCEDLYNNQKPFTAFALNLVFVLSCLIVALIAVRNKWDWLVWIAVISGVLAIGLFLSWVYWKTCTLFRTL